MHFDIKGFEPLSREDLSNPMSQWEEHGGKSYGGHISKLLFIALDPLGEWLVPAIDTLTGSTIWGLGLLSPSYPQPEDDDLDMLDTIILLCKRM